MNYHALIHNYYDERNEENICGSERDASAESKYLPRRISIRSSEQKTVESSAAQFGMERDRFYGMGGN